MNALSDLLSSRARAEVFRLLFATAGLELHGRELARRSKLNEATVRQELQKLARLGIVEVRRSGNRTYFKANALHPLYPDIRNIVLKTSGLVDVLREALTDPRVRFAFVFGSIANGTEKATSDVDLMVLGSIRLRELTGLLAESVATLGREINPHILTPEEFARRRTEGDHFINSVLASPKLFVIGSEDELGRMGRERMDVDHRRAAASSASIRSMRMKSDRHGKRSLAAEVTNVSASGFWMIVADRELFVPFMQFPWFREATIGRLTHVQSTRPGHLRWPDLDIDLAVESIEHPDKFPLVSRMEIKVAPREKGKPKSRVVAKRTRA